MSSTPATTASSAQQDENSSHVPPHFPFGKLPVELRRNIVLLVSEQDRAYRERVSEHARLVGNPEIIGRSLASSPVGWYGRGLSSLMLCSRELHELARELIHSNLTLRMAENPLFPFVIIPRHKSHIKSITLSPIPVMAPFPSIFLVALPQFRKLRKVILQEYPSWILKFSHKYGHHPLASIASRILHLEMGHFDNQDQDLRLMLECLQVFPALTSLKLITAKVSKHLLTSINNLAHLKTLDLTAQSFDLSPGITWKKGNSLLSVFIKTWASWEWTPELWNWIRSFGDQLKPLALSDEVGKEQVPVFHEIGPITFPSLRRLSLDFSAVRAATQLNFFSACPQLVYLSLPYLSLWSIDSSPQQTDPSALSEIVKMVAQLDKLEEALANKAIKIQTCMEEARTLEIEFCNAHGWMYQDGFPTEGPAYRFFDGEGDENNMRTREEINLLEFALRTVARNAQLRDKRASEEMWEMLEGVRELYRKEQE